MYYLLLVISILPVFIICSYIYNKDRHKEPNKLLIKLFLFGFTSIIVVFLLSYLVFYFFPNFLKEPANMSFIEMLIYTFIIVGLIEELCKWIIVYIFGYKSRENDEVYDLIVYAVFVSLGFACIENILYVFTEQSISIGLFRGIFAIPGHASFAIAMGYYLSKARIYGLKGNLKLKRKNILLSLIIPVVLHGIYDFCLLSESGVLILVFFVFIISLYKVTLSRLKDLT